MSSGPALYEESQGFSPWLYVLIGAVLLLIAGILSWRMRTTVTPERLTVRYGPIGALRVAISDIARAEAVVYRPIRDYGGWGLRGWGRRRAVNARGDRGVLVVRRDGSTVLVGSQDPRALLEALSRAGVATEDKLPPALRDL